MPPEAAERVREILVCRHGETVWNRERRVMGALDVPLSENGRRQCAKLAEVLCQFSITRIISSPLARAAESARILADALATELTFDKDLEEVHFGRWQGKCYEEIVEDPDYERFLRDPVGTPTPGGETVADVQQRGLSVLARVAAGERALVVSHGDIIRAVLCHYLAIPLREFRRIRIDNCGVSAIVEGDGRVEVKFVNMLADPDRAWDPLHWARAT